MKAFYTTELWVLLDKEKIKNHAVYELPKIIYADKHHAELLQTEKESIVSVKDAVFYIDDAYRC